MYAVDPATVRATARQLTGEQIIDELATMSGRPEWVTISGGNPALHELGPVVEQLHDAGYRVSVETQGSRWRDWLATVDRLTISPKPPSSGMATTRQALEFGRFKEATAVSVADRAALKIVCFDEVDLDWAVATASDFPDLPLYLSAGTPVPAPPGLRDAVGERYRWLCERVAETPALARARVLPQLHVIAWKDAAGV
jgi:7-carboxy-7-deazaguanine synthase